jgi:phage terminase small subunit
MDVKPLTPKQQRFVDEYLLDLNATRAAIRAGYSVKNAEAIGCRLVKKSQVAAAIREAMRQRSAATGITASRVLEEIGLLAFSDIGQVLDFSGDEPRLLPARKITKRARRALASIKVKRYVEGRGDDAREVEVTEFKLWDKLSALDKAARHVGLYAPEQHEHTGPGGGPFQHEYHARRLAAFRARYGGDAAGDAGVDGGGKPPDPPRPDDPPNPVP